MTLSFKPMLSADASDVDLSTLKYPLLISPKLDGIRCIIWDGIAYSRNAKPIRNHFVQKWATKHHNLDGELIVGSPTDPLCLNKTQSGVMSFEGEPDFHFWMFDNVDREHPQYHENFGCQWPGDPRVKIVPHYMVYDHAALLAFEERFLAGGYEGVMLRGPNSPYKHGRSTLREGYLMKLKRFTDGEAVVIRLEEGHVNTNELQRDELGRAKRSTHQENLVPSGMVGTIIAMDPTWGELRISPGTMPHVMREAYWNFRGVRDKTRSLEGKTIHWRSFGYGVKDKPRFPRFYGIREDV